MFKDNDRVRFQRIAQADYKPDERFDIIIDDGSHRMSDQQQTFINLFDKANLFYILEDLHTSNPPIHQNYGFTGNNSTIEFLEAQRRDNKINLDLIYKNDGLSVTSIIRK